MLRIAQILYNKAHYIFESEEMPDWPPDPQGNPIVLVDITDKPEVQEGWDYNGTGEFTEPVYEGMPHIEPGPTAEELMAQQLTDMEIQQMEHHAEATEEREFLGQQLSDLEISMLERGL